jgi:acetylglutamate kinase
VVIVLKYGGNALAGQGGPDPLLDEIAERVAGGDRVVLVHGGGPQIDAALAERGIPQRRVAGLRVTDGATLAVTESVLCGTVNKALVRALLARGVRAAGISGQDGALLVARKMAPIDGQDLGFVGEIASVNPAVIEGLFAAEIVPVVAPLAVTADGGTVLNVNADTSAGAIAGALTADAYVIITNVERVRLDVDDPASGIGRIDEATARRYMADGIFSGGMLPKMESALDALAHGAHSTIICGSTPGALGRALVGEGTTVVRG